jgi:hypothetical protein
MTSSGNRRKVDLAGAESPVLVHAPAHVVELHVDGVLGDRGDAFRHAHRSTTRQCPMSRVMPKWGGGA